MRGGNGRPEQRDTPDASSIKPSAQAFAFRGRVPISPLLAPLIQKGFMSADFADALRLCTLPSCSLTALIQSNRRVTYKQVNPFDYQFGSSQKFY